MVAFHAGWQPPLMPSRRATDQELLHRIGKRLRRYRERQRLTQEQLAARAQLQPESISRIETGAVSASLTTLGALAAGLEVPLGDLVDGERDLPLAGLDPRERALLERWRTMSGEQQLLLVQLLNELRSPMDTVR